MKFNIYSALGVLLILAGVLLYMTIHFVVVPLIIVWVFSVFGVEITYWIGLGLWVGITFIAYLLK